MKETKRTEIIIGLFGRKKEKSFEEKVEERLKELNYTRGRFSVENQIRKEEEAVRMAKMRCAIKHQGYINALDYRLNEEVSTRRLKNPAEIERLKNELKRDYFKAEAAICREREEDIQRNREIGLFGRKKNLLKKNMMMITTEYVNLKKNLKN